MQVICPKCGHEFQLPKPKETVIIVVSPEKFIASLDIKAEKTEEK